MAIVFALVGYDPTSERQVYEHVISRETAQALCPSVLNDYACYPIPLRRVQAIDEQAPASCDFFLEAYRDP